MYLQGVDVCMRVTMTFLVKQKENEPPYPFGKKMEEMLSVKVIIKRNGRCLDPL